MTLVSRELQQNTEPKRGLPSQLWSHSLKRALLVIAGCLFVGLAANGLVAWAIAVWLPYPDPRIWDNPTSGPLARITDIPADWPTTDHIARRSAVGRTEWQFMQRGDPITYKPPPDYTVLHLYCVGWPFETLESQLASRHAFGSLPSPAWPSAIRIPGVLRPEWFIHLGREYQDDLPLRPIWPAFALNTLFYAAIVFGASRLLLALRRSRRRRRYRCISCGYPISSLATCPECGAPVATPSKIPQPPSPISASP